MAIGWHFFYEGLSKIQEGKEGGEGTFSAEGYLRNATGPFGPYFRSLVPDPEGLNALDAQRIRENLAQEIAAFAERLKASWADELEQTVRHYHFSQDQRDKAVQELRAMEARLDEWLGENETIKHIQDYAYYQNSIRQAENEYAGFSHGREWLKLTRTRAEASRKDLLGPITTWTKSLRESWKNIATDDQRRAGPYLGARTQLDWVNDLTKYGLVAAGLGLIFGLFTRLAALGAAAFLALIYLSIPPWPGLPEVGVTEGHYFIVSKNLIEMLACLALACLPTGHWLGVDALLFGWLDRRRARAEETSADEPAAPIHPPTTTSRPSRSPGAEPR